MGGAGLDGLSGWVTLVRAPNPGPMTLDGTNTWVLRAPGHERAVVVDPGPLDEGHLVRIAELGPFEFILVTHGHHDHVEGVARLSELLGGTPVRSGEARLTTNGLDIRVLDTPGHTADSVCFLVECGNEQVMLTGDTLLGRGTTVVAKPDGDLGDYLRSLDVLAAYGKVLMLPGHGPVRTDVAAVANEYREHRRERLAQVEAAMAAGADTPEKVVDLVYPEIEPRLRFAAEWSAAAQLDYLRHKNRESGTPPDGLDRL
jgi:glyoxylase-like metal-dependent hydrolase (beta-lactamase superfamily II)